MSLPKEVWDRIKALKVTMRHIKNPPESHQGSFRGKLNSVRRLAHGGKPETNRLPSNHERVLAGRAK